MLQPDNSFGVVVMDPGPHSGVSRDDPGVSGQHDGGSPKRGGGGGAVQEAEDGTLRTSAFTSSMCAFATCCLPISVASARAADSSANARGDADADVDSRVGDVQGEATAPG